MWWVRSAKGFVRGICDGGKARSGVRVLCYHGVVERITDPVLERNFHTKAQFQDHLELLTRCRVISIADLLQEINYPTKSLKPTVVLTIDDGYANNLLAADILHNYRVPWTLFVSTGVLGRECCLWTTELALLLLHGVAPQVEAEGAVWPLQNWQERERAFHAVRKRMKCLPAPKRRQTLEEIRQQFPTGESERLLAEFPSLQMLTWDEIRQLATSDVDIQSHGVDHEIHHAEQLESVRLWELITSREEILRQVGKECIAFAYPNGNFLPQSKRELQAGGYALGFTTVAGTVTVASSPFYLPRLMPPKSLQSFTKNLFWETR